ncbi:MAG: phosphoribosylglycinamide formyltransferase [Sedimentisphaerales bacterium]|nr:phosphoribosylglycinamide formyltransferase [Sedimentisphaerales bacterium]
MSDSVVAYIDGGSRGNPGPAASGFVLSDKDGNLLLAKGLFLGKKTNNEAEYTALVKALEAALEINAKKIMIFSDSELLVKQINGEYKVKSEKILPLYEQASSFLYKFAKWKVQHVYREKNKIADGLVNEALDMRQDVVKEPKAAAPKAKPIRLGVLLSGGGRTLLNILDEIEKGNLNAEVSVVISSLATVAGVERAKKAGLDVKVIRKNDYSNIDEFSAIIEKELNAAKVDLVIQAGWLCLWKIPAKYENKVMNIHPALLPSFGGKGMWGHHVHEAVLKKGCKISGCTVHFCTNEYDEGPIIIQRTCPVYDSDTPETLAARVFEQECIAYPEAIKLFAEEKLHIQKGIVKIISSI